MVFNHAARKLIQKAGLNINPVVHDWFLYMVVSGCGGVVIYDPVPGLRYRQHAANLIGEWGYCQIQTLESDAIRATSAMEYAQH